MTTILEQLQQLAEGDRISLIIAGTIVEGTYEGVVDNCVVLNKAVSPSIAKKRYSFRIPIDNIYAWGRRDRKQDKVQKKEKKQDKTEKKGKKKDAK